MPYKPNLESGRVFNKDKKYSDIDWSNWQVVVDEFETRLKAWYLQPTEYLRDKEHIGFPLIVLSCLLIDTLSQWEDGELKSRKKLFKEYVGSHVKNGSTNLPKRIVHYENGGNTQYNLENNADALYEGFRCGVMHEAHAKLYCMILAKGEDEIFYHEEEGLTLYEDGRDCVSVLIDPFELLDAVKEAFENYISRLRDDNNPDNQKLIANFKKKFRWSFGIDLQ
jgi:hypothetical protein